MKTLTFTLPAPWASYLVNGDDSGLEPGEQEQCDAFLARNGISANDCLDCSEESWFARDNDATRLGGDVMDFVFNVR